ncbi:MAG: MoaD/ThiS family protein [Candidatus Thorarchaeota archaeon]
MKVKVKLYATLRRFAPDGTDIGDAFEVKYPGTTLQELVQHLGFSSEQVKIIMVNGQRVTDKNEKLAENDLVVIFPPIGGG